MSLQGCTSCASGVNKFKLANHHVKPQGVHPQQAGVPQFAPSGGTSNLQLNDRPGGMNLIG